MAQLTHLSIRRLITPAALLPLLPANIVVPGLQTGHSQTAIPQDLLETIIERGALLEDLCLDWWSLDLSELKTVLKSLSSLRRLCLAIRGSFLGVVSLMTYRQATADG
jgi:hypothetical protein